MNKVALPAEPADASVRERLLHAAVELFATKGYAATTVREIVAAAGVTKPVLYYYFQSKEGIYLQIMRSMLEKFLAPLAQGPPTAGTVRERLKALAIGSYSTFIDNLQVMKISFGMYYGPPQGAPFVDTIQVYWQFHEAAKVLVEEGLAKGELSPGDPEAITSILMGTVHLAMELELAQPGRGMGVEGLSKAMDYFFDNFPGCQP